MVRTKTAGHIRDIRRLVVAMSRARLGCYVFCRQSLYENTYELRRTFNQLLQRPTKLTLCPQERTEDGSCERLVSSGTPIPLSPPPSSLLIIVLCVLCVCVWKQLTAKPAAVLPINDVVEMGQFVADMTKAIQAQHVEYQRRYREFYAKQAAEKEAAEKRERDRLAAIEASEKADAALETELEKERRFAAETAQMDRELGLTAANDKDEKAPAGSAAAAASASSSSASASAASAPAGAAKKPQATKKMADEDEEEEDD